MADTTQDMTINFDIKLDPSKAEQGLDRVAAAAKRLAGGDEELQKKLEKRMRTLEEMARIEEKLAGTDWGKKKVSDEEQYNQKLEKTIRNLREKDRLERDLQARGVKGPALTGEAAYQAKLGESVTRRQEQERMKRDMIAQGVMEDPEAKRRQAAEQRVNDELRRNAMRREKKDEKDEKEKSYAVWRAMLQGGFGQAALTQAFGVGGTTNMGMAGLHALDAGMRTTTNIGNVLQNTSLTGSEKGRGIGRSLGLCGVIDFVDMLSGRSESKRQFFQERLPIQEITTRAGIERQQVGMSMGFQAGSAQNRAEALGNFTPVGTNNYDRFSSAGKIAYENEQKLWPLLNQRRRAELEITAAKKTQAKEEAKLYEIDTDIARLSEKQRALRKTNQYGGADIAQHQINLAEEKRVSDELSGKLSLKQQAEQRVNQARGVTSQAQYSERAADIAVKKEKISQMEERRSRTLASSERFGFMGEADKMMGIEAFQEMKRAGWANLTQEQKQMVASVDPETARLEAQKQGIEDPYRKQLQGMGGLAGEEGNMAGLQRLQNEISTQKSTVEVMINLNESALAEQIAKHMSSWMQGLFNEIEARMKKDKQDVFQKQQMRNAAQS